MSESDNETSTSDDSPKSEIKEQRRSTLADFRQNSFETRYRSLINKQILENSINSEEIKRQLHNFLPFGPYGDSARKTINSNKNNDKDKDKDNSTEKLDEICKVEKELLNSDDIKEEDESEEFEIIEEKI